MFKDFFFRPPRIYTQISKELVYARLDKLESQALFERADARLAMLTARVDRLELALAAEHDPQASQKLQKG